MSEESWQGSDLLAALRHAATNLRLHVDEVNALNVFPVPDGDTGSNMLATLQAAVDEAESAIVGNGSLPHVASAISGGALMGARGNSGVILSQLFRGVAESLHETEALDGRLLARALEAGCASAFAAVARPVEGTILTVARDAAAAAAEAARREKRIESVLSAAVDAAAASVERTPSLLPILRQAEVVDAGGRGLELVLRGALAHARGEAPVAPSEPAHDVVFPAFEALEEEEYGYETVFVVRPEAGSRLDVAAIRGRLEELGESVLVAGDDRAVKIHVHNERPDEIIAYGLALGTLSHISVENMDRQAQRRRGLANASATNRAPAGATTAPLRGGAVGLPEEPAASRSGPPPIVREGPAVVAVAPGAGLEQLFRTLGAEQVVRADNGVNASAGELADAIRATGCRDVLVLPNNPNVRLAATQGGALCAGQNVMVVATRNAAEGVAALLALDGSAELAANAGRMLKAARATLTLQVAEAVRDARLGRRRVRKGEHIVLRADGKLLAAGPARDDAVLKALEALKHPPELITLYHGEGATADDAAALAERVRERYADAEVEVVDGGQAHYSYFVAAE